MLLFLLLLQQFVLRVDPLLFVLGLQSPDLESLQQLVLGHAGYPTLLVS